MLYVQQFQNNRLDYLRKNQHLRSSANRNFSLYSNQYMKKFPKLCQPKTPNISNPRNQTLFFLSRKSSSEMKLMNENQQQTGIIQKNKNPMTTLSKSSTRDDNKQISNENSATRLYHQVSRNVYGLAKSTTNRNQSSTSFSPSNRTTPELFRPTTAPIILEENFRRTISARLKSNPPSRSQNSRVIDLSHNFNNLTNSSCFQLKSAILESENPLVQESYINTSNRDHFLDSFVVTKSSGETITQDEPKILHQDSQSKMNGFQHIANLGTKNRQIEPSEISHEEDLSKDMNQRIYEYKSPFSEEYDQAISLQAQIQTNNNSNEWNLKDFYRDVKTQFEPGTNTKSVFEKCLKLSRLQATTIKWEQRRHQNLNIYNRLLKNSTLDSHNNNVINFNGNFPPNINELKRELRCNECKRVSCLGNCAPGHEYHQYKRCIPLSSSSSLSSPNTREQIRSKFGLRPQRSMSDLRPRSTQQITRIEQTNLNPVVVVPLFDDDSQTKRPQKQLNRGFFPGKSFRSSRRETLTLISSHKILS